MNKFFLFVVVFFCVSMLPAVSAVDAFAEWTANQNTAITITQGDSVEFFYSITSVSGRYNITLYKDDLNHPVKTLVPHTTIPGYGLEAWMTLTAPDYQGYGNYFVYVRAQDQHDSMHWRIDLEVVCHDTDQDGVCDDDEIPFSDLYVEGQQTDPEEKPFEVQFTCQATGGNAPLTYRWDFGDGNQLSGIQNPVHTYDEPGDYEAKCTVHDADNDHISGTVPIHLEEIVPNQPPILKPIGDQTVYVGETLSFTITATDPDHDKLGYAVEELPQGATFSLTTFSWTPTADDVGKHEFTFTVTDGVDEDEETITITVTEANRPPHAAFSFTPENPTIFEMITFDGTLSTDPDQDVLRYAWDFDADGHVDSASAQPVYSYEVPGAHKVTLTVSDGILTDTVTKTVWVTAGLQVEHISCLDPIVAGHTQSCGVHVTAEDHNIQDATVNYYFEDGSWFGSCTTDKAGDCRAERVIFDAGNYTVYATAEKQGYDADTDKKPSFSFSVFSERYDVRNLRVYADNQFSQESYDFYRGENLYVQFQVYEYDQAVTNDVVTKAVLVSRGESTAELAEMSMEHNYYRFKLTPIPLQYDYYGESQIFAFAFNFTDESGGQEQVHLVIRNNPPEIFPPVQNIVLNKGESISVDLSHHELDLEDAESPSDDLSWDFAYASTNFDVGLVGKTLTVTGVAEGDGTILLTLTDWDGDTAIQNLQVEVLKEELENQPPVVTITAPQDGALFEEDTLIQFRGTVVDPEQGVLQGSWTSNSDGFLGSGNVLTKKLSVGTHVITFSATDSQGLSDQGSITIVVKEKEPENQSPIVTIVKPQDGATFTDQDSIHFVGAVVDDFDTALIPNWHSSIDGDLGNGLAIYNTLSVGTHRITLRATDSEGLTGKDTITLTVDEAEEPNDLPEVTILFPATNSIFTETDTITFEGKAVDDEDGVLIPHWYSSKDGFLGSGNTITNQLSVGTHTITLAATDTGGLTGKDTITLYIEEDEEPENKAPVVTITSPADGTTVQEGTSIHFTGTAIDPEEGTLIGSWYSHKDGFLGNGNSLEKVLSIGNHTITFKAADSEGLSSHDTIHLVVEKDEEPETLSADINGPYQAYPGKKIKIDASGSTGNIARYMYDFGDGETLTKTAPFTYYAYRGNENAYTLTLTVYDHEGNSDTDTTTVTMLDLPDEDEEPLTDMYVGSIDLFGLYSGKDRRVNPNDELVVLVDLKNDGDTDLEHVKIVAMIPELATKVTVGPFVLEEGDREARRVMLPIYDAPPGEYYLKLVIGDPETTTVKYRYVIVE